MTDHLHPRCRVEKPGLFFNAKARRLKGAKVTRITPLRLCVLICSLIRMGSDFGFARYNQKAMICRGKITHFLQIIKNMPQLMAVRFGGIFLHLPGCRF